MGGPSSRESNPSFKANAPDAAAKAEQRDLEKISVSLTVNGQRRALTIEPRMTLLDALREELVLTGTKTGMRPQRVRRVPCMWMGASLRKAGGAVERDRSGNPL